MTSSATMKEWRLRNREKIRKQQLEWRKNNRQSAKHNNLRRFGWTLSLFQQRLVEQNARCAICFRDLNVLSPRHIHADHCHLTDIPRGILCNDCNLGLGRFKDDQKLLQSAIRYLINWR